MKFNFSLESVLRVREHEEKVQKQKLAKKISEKKQLSEQRLRLEEKLKGHLDEEGSEEFKSLHNLKRHREYIHQVHQKMEKLNGSLEIVENAVDQERDKLAAVHKERHIMEKVKEEEREEFLEKVSRYQQKVMDEIATQSFSR
ncbi:flagellar export protein FliJ [Aliifodinibius salicampi]|uniref:Flagellar FliJ protein n=1 Tax=Fodinibius salicampi TaxID=1920655 RepID=A0ABT3Q0J9_9BACT|nr:flagellar export protein FliJ [Fodinibius salicampi]MCW9713619.1 flagellar export protein FliJ [Fodinibius salicampi]